MGIDEDQLIDEPTLLKALLKVRHWQKLDTFAYQWDKVAKTIDSRLVGSCPAHAQFYRWLSGSIRSMPHPDACRVLEAMFPGWTVQQLFQPVVRTSRSMLLRTPIVTPDNNEDSATFTRRLLDPGMLRGSGKLASSETPGTDYDELVASKREYAERQRRSNRAHHEAGAQRLRRAGQLMVPALIRAAGNDLAVSTSSLPLPVTSYADTAYLEAVQQHIWHIIELDNRFGSSDLARLAVRFFRSLHQQLGTGAYEPAIERDLQAAAGELAEVAGWLLYDADRQDDVRRMNHEALYFSRLAGDRCMELLTLQNASMHAGHLGRPREALHLADSVLESRDRLSPRVKTLFLMRKARARAQGGDEHALRLFGQVRSHYQDGMRDSDPKWAWWIDERELAWHEGMALVDLGRPCEAVEKFEQSVWAATPHQVRGRYVHLGYLLGAQVKVGAWSDAKTTMRQIATMVSDVSSTRAVVLLAGILPELKHEHVPGSTRETAEQLTMLLSQG